MHKFKIDIFDWSVKMEWKGLNELREIFINFFKSKGHMFLESFPLVIESGGSLLYIHWLCFFEFFGGLSAVVDVFANKL